MKHRISNYSWVKKKLISSKHEKDFWHLYIKTEGTELDFLVQVFATAPLCTAARRYKL